MAFLSGGAWKWIIGVPVVVIGGLMAFGDYQAKANPEKMQAWRVYELCQSDLASADRARSGSAAIIAGECERLRKDYIKKYGTTP